MTGWHAAATALQWAAAATSVGVARAREDYRPIAVFLVGVSVVNVVRLAALASLVEPFQREHPGAALEGLARIGGHVEAAGFLSWYFGLGAVALAVFSRRPGAWKVVALLWALAVGALAWTYPLTRGPVLEKVYLGAELGALLVGLGTGIQWAWRREAPTAPFTAAVLLIGMDVAVLLGPYRFGLFNSWVMAQIAYVALYGALLAVNGGVLWNRRLSGSSR